MSRRHFVLALGVLFVVGFGGAAAFVALIRHEPAAYARPPMPEEPADLQKRSSELKNRVGALVTAIANESEWDEQITDEQINSYLENDFLHDGLLKLPEGISRPRVVFGADRIHLAFRYGSGVWSTVVSIDLRVWLPKCERNAVALELEGFHAGALPISAQSLLERVAEIGRQSGMDVSWYRTNGHPVALLRFGVDQPRTTAVLDAVKLQPGSLAIVGHAIEPIPARAMLPTADAGQQPAEN